MSKIENIKFHSQILDKDMGMQVVLPDCYFERNPLPVLYLNHGRRGDETTLEMLDTGKVLETLISSSKIKPYIIVCPRLENSRGINSSLVTRELSNEFHVNLVYNLGMYEDYFIKEVIPMIDEKYNTLTDRDNRFVGGFSSGGYAALHYAFHHQDMFSKVGGHMPAIELGLEEDDKLFFSDLASFEDYDPVSIARTSDFALGMDIYLDAGNHDEGEFYKGCTNLYEVLKTKNVNVENHLYEGHHNDEYVKSNLEEYLMFYGK